MADGDGGSKGIFKPAVIPALGIDEIQAVTHGVVALQTEAGGQHGLFIGLGGDFPGFHRIELSDVLPIQHHRHNRLGEQIAFDPVEHHAAHADLPGQALPMGLGVNDVAQPEQIVGVKVGVVIAGTALQQTETAAVQIGPPTIVRQAHTEKTLGDVGREVDAVIQASIAGGAIEVTPVCGVDLRIRRRLQRPEGEPELITARLRALLGVDTEEPAELHRAEIQLPIAVIAPQREQPIHIDGHSRPGLHRHGACREQRRLRSRGVCLLRGAGRKAQTQAQQQGKQALHVPAFIAFRACAN